MTYANTETITTLTQEIQNTLPETDYTSILEEAINHSELKIQRKLALEQITPPINDEDLTDASNLYAAAFILTTYYSGNETISPTAKSYIEDANEALQDFINKPVEDDTKSRRIGFFVAGNTPNTDVDEDEDDIEDVV